MDGVSKGGRCAVRLTTRCRVLLGCIADVLRGRRRVAKALRDLRRSCWPKRDLRALRFAEQWMAASMRTLELAWACCVLPEASLT